MNYPGGSDGPVVERYVLTHSDFDPAPDGSPATIEEAIADLPDGTSLTVQKTPRGEMTTVRIGSEPDPVSDAALDALAEGLKRDGFAGDGGGGGDGGG